MFDLSVVSLLLRAVPCREVGSVGEKTGGGALCAEKKIAVVRGLNEPKPILWNLFPVFVHFFPCFEQKSPSFVCFLPSFSRCFGGVCVSSGEKSVVLKELGVN